MALLLCSVRRCLLRKNEKKLIFAAHGTRRPLLILVACITLFSPHPSAQQIQSTGTRKIVSELRLKYPTLARKLGLRGNVKIVAVVDQNGTVMKCDVLGGSPAFIPTVVDTVKRWRWQAGPPETRELIEISFHPN